MSPSFCLNSQASKLLLLSHNKDWIITSKGKLFHVPVPWSSACLTPLQSSINMPPKRKRSSIAANSTENTQHLSEASIPISRSKSEAKIPLSKRRASSRGKIDTNPDHNPDIIDGRTALRASPDADEIGEVLDVKNISGLPNKSAESTTTRNPKTEFYVPDVDTEISIPERKKKAPTKSSIAAKKGADEIKAFMAVQRAKKVVDVKAKQEDGDEWEQRIDPDGDNAATVEDVDIMKKEAARPPPVNSDYLPLPWKGRLGYVRISNYFCCRNAVLTFSRRV